LTSTVNLVPRLSLSLESITVIDSGLPEFITVIDSGLPESITVIDSGLVGSTRGTTRAEDARGTPTQSHASPRILVYDRLRVGWLNERYHESMTCSRHTYPESYITQYNSIPKKSVNLPWWGDAPRTEGCAGLNWVW